MGFSRLWAPGASFLTFILMAAVACGTTATPTPALEPTATPATGGVRLLTPTATAQPTPPTAESNLVPKSGGVIPMHAFIVGTLQPLHIASSSTFIHAAPMYNSLTEINPETDELYAVRGDLAQSWTLASDGVTYTFKLAENAKWHDGRPVTAEDVAFSLQLENDPNSIQGAEFIALKEATGGRVAGQNIVHRYYSSSRAIDANTVEVKIKRPAAGFLKALSMDDNAILPKHLLAEGRIPSFKEPQNLIGSGPFKLKHFEKDILTEQVRNEDYFKEGRPYLDGLIHHVIIDKGTVVTAFKAGQVLMGDSTISNLSVREGLQLEKELGGRATVNWITSFAGANGVMMNSRVKPFDDARVRRAINLVLHRQPIIETMGGKNPIGTPLQRGFWWSYPEGEALKMPGFRELNGEKHPDDIKEAQRLMQEAGAGLGTQLTLSCRPIVEECDLAVLVKEQLKMYLGWDITVKQLEPAAAGEAYHAGDYQFAILGLAVQNYDADGPAFSYRKGSGQYYRNTGFYNADAEPIWEEVNRETDQKVRKDLMRKANDFLLQDNAWPLLFWQVQLWVVDNRIHNFHAPSSFFTHKKHEHLWCDPEC